jgi:hypothetical protein
MTSRLWAAVALASLVAGCPSTDPGPPIEDSGRIRDAGMLDGSASDTGPIGDTGPRLDTGPTMHDASVHCPAGQHACGAGCITDQANDPMNGCRFGCGSPCPTPTMGTASCTSAGTCDFTCPSPFHRVGDTCVCMATTCMAIGYTCGAPDDGCGTPLNCGTCSGGAMCVGGTCGCAPDAHESNDSNAVATHEAALTDMPDSNVTLSDFTIDHMGDQDWMQFHVTDAFDGGNPHITVRLYNIPSGTDLDLGVWYVCAGGGDASACSVGTQNNMIGRGCISSHTGIAEENVDLPTDCGFLANADGTLFVRVTAPTFGNSCMPYAVDVRVR